ncbi:hypothetical protein ACN20G_30850 (plasmid) [Streptomyces sp. BI20]|uniref:hypothetical protein n=1 Tax=Streptomyces sp. BI20 TaxID=3403460 RepID=UPI003C739706
MRRCARVAAVAAAGLILTAGGTSAAFADPSDDPSSAAAELCTDLSELGSDSAALRALNPASATKDQVKEAYKDVQDSWKNVAESTATWDTAKKDAVKKAADALVKAYKDLPGDTTGTDALRQLSPHTAGLESAVTTARTGLTCPS